MIPFLAQVPRTDNFGNIFGDMFEQIPVALLVQVCISAILLVGVSAFFVYRRRRRAQAAQAAQVEYSPVGYVTNPNEPVPAYQPATSAYDHSDMPDLDFLTDRSSLVHEAPAKVARPGVFSVKLHNGQQTEAREILSILRDTDDDRLIVQMDATAYRTLVDSPDAKKNFTQIMKELAEVVMKPDTRITSVIPTRLEDEPIAPAPTSEVEPDVQPNLRDLIDDAPKPPARTYAPPPPVTPEGAMPGDLSSYKLEDNPIKVTKGGLLGRQKFESAPVPELNLAAAIEAYLQHKIRHTPEFSGRNIHVHSAPGGGVRIEVDGRFYEAVGDVSEPEVREFLSATIQEWHERQ